jgi:hypothetical protein
MKDMNIPERTVQWMKAELKILYRHMRGKQGPVPWYLVPAHTV